VSKAEKDEKGDQAGFGAWLRLGSWPFLQPRQYTDGSYSPSNHEPIVQVATNRTPRGPAPLTPLEHERHANPDLQELAPDDNVDLPTEIELRIRAMQALRDDLENVASCPPDTTIATCLQRSNLTILCWKHKFLETAPTLQTGGKEKREREAADEMAKADSSSSHYQQHGHEGPPCNPSPPNHPYIHWKGGRRPRIFEQIGHAH